MMKPIITKTGMVLAVAATAALPNLATAADGWDYSGAHARASALQLDYFSLDGDIGNIWGNPALAKQYSNTMELSITDDDRQDINRVDDNVGRSGAGTTNGGVAGILHGLNDATTVGAYIGRDRADMAGFDIADGLNDGDLGVAGTAQNPQNQFDIFYATGLDNMDIGVRFNFQAKEDTTSGPTEVSVSSNGNVGNVNNITADGIRAQLEDDNDADQSVSPTPEVDLVAELGKYTEQRVKTSSGWDASEMNITVGLNLFDGLDGSIQLGSADGTLYDTETTTATTYEYTGPADDEVLTQVESFNEKINDSVSVDSGQSMALALRYQLTDNWLTSLAYSSFDYGGKMVRSTESTDIDLDTNDNGLVGNNEDSVTIVTNDVQTGTSVREGSTMALNGAYTIDTNDTGAVIIATGLVMMDRDTGYSLSTASDNVETTDTGANPQVTTAFNSPTGTFEKEMTETSSTMIPLTIALEQGLSDKWERWTLRGSVSKNLYQSTETKVTEYFFDTRVPNVNQNGVDIDGGRWVQTDSETVTDEEMWADRETTVRLGFGYTRGDFTVDTVFSATVDRLFTADHKILEDSKFGKVTVAYNY